MVPKVSGEFMEALKAAEIFSWPLSSSGLKILNSFTGERDSKVFKLLFELAKVIQEIAISKKLQKKLIVIIAI